MLIKKELEMKIRLKKVEKEAGQALRVEEDWLFPKESK
jgi:hypothetical protein